MAKYTFPAVITAEDDYYYVNFPDVKNCFTDGKTLTEALEMAEDVLALMLCNYEDTGETIREPSDLKSVRTADNQIATLIYCDTSEYRRLYLSKAVKKTITIPAWLNTRAERAGVNFSGLMQKSLKEYLNIE